MKYIAAASVLVASCLMAATAGQAKSFEIEAICERAMHAPVPEEDVPDPEAARSLQGCSSEALYYGIGMPADPVRARQCAWLEWNEESGTGGPLSGAGMLMTIYANGVGAVRDLNLATRFACQTGGAPMEIQGRVSYLQSAKTERQDITDFHFCDHITSGYAAGVCMAHYAAIENAKRARKLDELIADWSDSDRQAFTALQDAANEYFETSSRQEVDLSGTARAAFVIESRQALNEQFIQMLQTLESGQAPTYSAAEFHVADTEMNKVYTELLADKADDDKVAYGTITAGGIREAQRAWLKYRDAWVEFAGTKYPEVSSDSLHTWLTEERTPIIGNSVPIR